MILLMFSTKQKSDQELMLYVCLIPPKDSLRAGGTTAMLDGLLESLKEIIHNGQSTFKFMMLLQLK